MPINAPIVRPDPAGHLLSAFQVADASARDYARLQMQRQQMAEAAVQRARENKAQDFKLMLAAVGEDNQQRQQAIENDFRAQQLGISRYSAETGRMNAGLAQSYKLQQLSRRADPLGLGPGASGGGYSSAGPTDDIPSYNGEESPEAPAGDLFPDQEAVNDLPQGGAPAPLMDGPLDPALQPPGEGTYGPPAPNESAPPAVSAAVPPSPAPQEGDSLLPPPRFNTPSFGGNDLSQEARNQVYGLFRTNAALTSRAQQATRQASITASAMRGADPSLHGVYQQKLEKEMAEAQTSAAAASEAKIKAAQLAKNAGVLEKRQAELGALQHLDGVLPESDRQTIMKEAMDPAAGGLADQKILTLKGYDQVRRAYGLDHASNGLQTAAQVARAGLTLADPDTQKFKMEAAKLEVYQNELKNLGEKPKGIDEAKEWVKTKSGLESEVLKLKAGAQMWKEAEGRFKNAVAADVRKPPEVEVMPEKPAAPAAPAAAAAPPLPPVSVDPAAPMPDAPESWSAIKEKFKAENPSLTASLAQIARDKPTFRKEELRQVMLTKAKDAAPDFVPLGYRTMAQVQRKGASNQIQGYEVAEAVLQDFLQAEAKKNVPPVREIKGWKVEKL